MLLNITVLVLEVAGNWMLDWEYLMSLRKGEKLNKIPWNQDFSCWGSKIWGGKIYIVSIWNSSFIQNDKEAIYWGQPGNCATMGYTSLTQGGSWALPSCEGRERRCTNSKFRIGGGWRVILWICSIDFFPPLLWLALFLRLWSFHSLKSLYLKEINSAFNNKN